MTNEEMKRMLISFLEYCNKAGYTNNIMIDVFIKEWIKE